MAGHFSFSMSHPLQFWQLHCYLKLQPAMPARPTDDDTVPAWNALGCKYSALYSMNYCFAAWAGRSFQKLVSYITSWVRTFTVCWAVLTWLVSEMWLEAQAKNKHLMTPVHCVSRIFPLFWCSSMDEELHALRPNKHAMCPSFRQCIVNHIFKYILCKCYYFALLANLHSISQQQSVFN